MMCRDAMSQALYPDGPRRPVFDVERCTTALRTVMQNFHPVFHRYFLERFPNACTWYSRRQAFVRSMATNSMIG